MNLHITIWLLTLTLISLSSFTQEAGNANPCSPPKTVSLTIGQEGIIECICDDSISLYWYFGNDTTAVKPFIYIDNSVKYGPGYSSGEYDIDVNGSLVIRNVTSIHGGTYAVLIIEPGNSVPRAEIFTVDVIGPEETDVMETYKNDQERALDNPEKGATITLDEPGKTSTSPVNDNYEQFVEVADITSLQEEIDQMKRIDRAMLALLVIVLIGIVLVIWRSYTVPLSKNSNCKEERVRCHQDLKQFLVACPGSCPCGKR
ncbi:hypothetical protein HOLleu_04150 [Holothuria leucospilota]|uniref:Immunoglobulin subtype domain-containing protein n=1 Tax=Holothuria leucospilota TaxID=206669 RepID=A0A9Q1CTW0_HOLLE|nr:hypothetical protein HOLleu_04150 [Holothuria leucospilota]